MIHPVNSNLDGRDGHFIFPAFILTSLRRPSQNLLQPLQLFSVPGQFVVRLSDSCEAQRIYV